MKTKYAALVAGIALVGGANAQTTITEYYTLNSSDGVVTQHDSAGVSVGTIQLLDSAGDPVTNASGLSYDGTSFYTFQGVNDVIGIFDGTTGVRTGNLVGPSIFNYDDTGFDLLSPTIIAIYDDSNGNPLVTGFDLAANPLITFPLTLGNGNAFVNMVAISALDVDGGFTGYRANGDVFEFDAAGVSTGNTGVNLPDTGGFAAFQFVTIPEPSSALLLGLGGLGLLARRKR